MGRVAAKGDRASPSGAQDGAASEIVGSMLLLAATVTIIGVAAATLMARAGDADVESPLLDVVVEARPGESSLRLLHTGGTTLDSSEMRVLVEQNGKIVYDGPITTAKGTWSLGEVATIGPIAGKLASGDRLDVNVVAKQMGRTVATTALALGERTVENAAFKPTVTLRLDHGGATAAAPRGSRVLIEAVVEHPAGRNYITRVTAQIGGINLPIMDLTDSGTGDDVRAFDGIYTRILEIPNTVNAAQLTVSILAVDLDGAKGTAAGTITLSPYARGKAASGSVFENIAPSSVASTLQLGNITWDAASYKDLEKDIIILRIFDTKGNAWTAEATFKRLKHDSTEIVIKEVTMWSAKGGCMWKPPKETVLSNPLDLLYPQNNQDMGTPSSSGGDIPKDLPACTQISPGVFTGSYQNAGVQSPATMVVVRVGDRDGRDERSALITTNVYIV